MYGLQHSVAVLQNGKIYIDNRLYIRTNNGLAMFDCKNWLVNTFMKQMLLKDSIPYNSQIIRIIKSN